MMEKEILPISNKITEIARFNGILNGIGYANFKKYESFAYSLECFSKKVDIRSYLLVDYGNYSAIKLKNARNVLSAEIKSWFKVNIRINSHYLNNRFSDDIFDLIGEFEGFYIESNYHIGIHTTSYLIIALDYNYILRFCVDA